MADNNKIKVDELNFDGIKSNLKNFLKGQEQFKDYDFDGSNLSILVDLLAYNTYYNNIYNNLAVNEMFLDSASKRDSVVSISKMLGYVPKSARSARATIEMTVIFPNLDSASIPNQITLPKNTQFSAALNEDTYYFNTLEERIATRNTSGVFTFSNLEIVEGAPVVQRYITEPSVRYLISNENADTSTLKVYVSENSGSGDPVVYSLSDTIVTADGNSTIYFLHEIENGLYELTFGDGVIGKALANGNLVTIEYLVSNGSDANQCRAFRTDISGIYPGNTTSITTITSAVGGAEPESLNSIKFNAPRSYFSQNRAVTIEDYNAVIFSGFDNVKAINVWGGDQNVPPIYGKAFVCIRPKTASYLSDSEKQYLVNLLKQKAVITVTTEIVDPIYMNLEVNTAVYYDPKETTVGGDAVADYVKNTILAYNSSDLEKFDAVFKQSKLSRLIDNSEKSIKSNVTTIKLRREIEPKFNSVAKYIIRLGNPVYTEGVPEEAVLTTGFYISGVDKVVYIRDDGVGNLLMYYMNGNSEVIVKNNVGTVDYVNGIVTINDLNISALDGNTFELIIKPQSYDVVALHNHVLNIPASNITVTAIVDTKGQNYTFTSSRS